MLRELLIEGCYLTQPPELMPVLQMVVTLCAAYGSPLKWFTFLDFGLREGTGLIGSDGSFVVTSYVLDEADVPFELDI